jgi:hypothetical protein
MLEFSIQECPEIGQNLSFRQQIHEQGQLEMEKKNQDFVRKLDDIALKFIIMCMC